MGRMARSLDEATRNAMRCRRRRSAARRLARQQQRVHLHPPLGLAPRAVEAQPAVRRVEEPERPRAQVDERRPHAELARVEDGGREEQRKREEAAEEGGREAQLERGARDAGQREEEGEVDTGIEAGRGKGRVQQVKLLPVDGERTAGCDVGGAAERKLTGKGVADAPPLENEEERRACLLDV